MRPRDGVRTAFAVSASLFVICLVLQVFLAGLGVFDDPGAFITHRNFGYLFGWLTLVMLVLAVAGRLGRRLVGLTALTLVQMALQSVFVAMRVDAPAVAALHPLNGMLMLVVCVEIARSAWIKRSSPAPMPARGRASAEAIRP